MNDKKKEFKTTYSVIPSDLIWKLQPLVININKEFKESLGSKYVGYWFDKNNIKESKSAIKEWIDELWDSDSVITSKIIFNSFKYSGIFITH